MSDRVKLRLCSLKNEIVSLHPNAPRHNDYYIHEEGDVELVSERSTHLERAACGIIRLNRAQQD
jgi:hypothetical protein